MRGVLERLHAAGLDSVPGGGAEILVDRVRKYVRNMTRGAINNVVADIDLEQKVDERLERQIGGVRPVPTAPADMIASQSGRNAA